MAGHHASRRRDRLVGPVVSVVAVVLITAPVSWAMIALDDGHHLADDLSRVSRTAADRVTTTRTSAPSRSGGDPVRPPGESGTNDQRPGSTGSVTITPERRPGSDQPAGPPSRLTPATPTLPPTVTPTPSQSSSTATPSTTSTGAADESVPSAYESEVLRLTNVERRKNGCDPVTADPRLTVSAGRHAEDMVDRHFFDHVNPDGLDPFERMGAAGFHGSAMAENIAMGYDTPEAVVDGWMNSDGHRRNILNCDYNRLGVGYDPGQIKDGYAGGSWVQNFGRV
jgi:uncharacterized protein YkwD